MIHLEKLTYENFNDVFELRVKKAQYPFVADNCYSVAEAYVTMMCGGHVFPFAIAPAKLYLNSFVWAIWHRVF